MKRIADALTRDLARLRFAPPVAFVYDPLSYARAPYDVYLERFGRPPREVLLLGMNPGPFGMAQTGVPFGDVEIVRDWLAIDAPVGRPAREHPKRPVLGLGCARREVSGSRLYGWARARFGTPEAFFDRFFVVNYCPLAFMTETGANLTPDRLPAATRARLFAACDRALRGVVDHLEPRFVIGLGGFAEARAREALAGHDVRIGGVLHPSPASPAANRGWAEQAERQLRALGIDVPGHASPVRRTS